MKINEIKTIEQSMSDAYFLKGKNGKPKESELKACLRFFEEIAIMMETKDPGTVDAREKALVGIWYAVMDRNVLISNFNLDTNEPSFIKNTIQTQ